jgi:hypothetical protein
MCNQRTSARGLKPPGSPVFLAIREDIPVVKSLLFLPSRFIHASADRTLQEVNIYEQRKYEVQHLFKKHALIPETCDLFL